MRIFLTGGSGYIGRHLLAGLTASGHTVMAMSRTPAADELIKQHGGQPLRCDLESVQAEHLQGCEMVIHAAAMLGSWLPYAAYEKVNVQGTKNLALACKQAGIRKMIFISTEAVILDGEHLRNADEKQPYPTLHFHYGKSKQAAERWLLQSEAVHGMRVMVLRPRMVWGGMAAVVMNQVEAAVLGKRFFWIDHGRYQTSTTHIDNLVHAVQLAVDRFYGGEIFFITDEEVHTQASFWRAVMKARGIQMPDRSLPGWLARFAAFFVEGFWRLLHLQTQPPITRFAAVLFTTHCTLSHEKAKQLLHYQPVISFQEGLSKLSRREPV
jgi:hypothetical protein